MADFTRLRAILEHGANRRILDSHQSAVLGELFEMIISDMESGVEFSNVAKYLSSIPDDIFENHQLPHFDILTRLKYLVWDLINPAISIVSPAENNRLITLNDTIRLAARIENVKLPAKGCKYEWFVMSRVIDGRFEYDFSKIIAKGIAKEDYIVNFVPASNKYLEKGENYIGIRLHGAFTRKQIREMGKKSFDSIAEAYGKDLISQRILINIVSQETANAIGQNYANFSELCQAVIALEEKVKISTTELEKLIEAFPKSKLNLERDFKRLEEYKRDLADIRELLSLNDYDLIERVLRRRDTTPIQTSIYLKLRGGMSFNDIILSKIAQIYQSLETIWTHKNQIEAIYQRRRFLKMGALGAGLSAAAAATGIYTARVFKGPEESRYKEEDFRKIKIAITRPSENYLLDRSIDIDEIEAKAIGQNKRLVEEINGGKMGVFQWYIFKDGRNKGDLNFRLTKSKRQISKLPDLDVSMWQLRAVLWIFNDKPMEEQPFAEVNVIFVKATIDPFYKIEGTNLVISVRVEDKSGKYPEYSVFFRMLGNNRINWDEPTYIKPNYYSICRLSLLSSDGTMISPGKYAFWIAVEPKENRKSRRIVSHSLHVIIPEKMDYGVNIKQINVLKNPAKGGDAKILHINYSSFYENKEHATYVIKTYIRNSSNYITMNDGWSSKRTDVIKWEIDISIPGKYLLGVSIRPFGTELPWIGDEKEFVIE